MTEISASPPGNAIPVSAQSPSPSLPQTDAASLAVKLLQPLDGLMLSGETASAEVISLKENPQNFQLTLRLTLNNGQQSTVQTSSPLALVQGTKLTVTANSDTDLTLLTQIGSGTKPMTSLDLQQLPVGSLLQGTVVSSERLPTSEASQATYKLIINLLNTPQAGNQLELQTQLNLPLGSLFSARVQDGQSLSFQPPSSQLGQLALSQHLSNQQSRQGSLSGLLSSLQGLDLQTLPNDLRGSVERLLTALPNAEQLSSSKGMAQALENSGLFLESRLVTGQTSALHNDMKANLLRLISQLLPSLPSAAPFAAASSNNMSQALPPLARNILGKIDQSNSRQQAMSFPLSSRTVPGLDNESDLDSLLKLATAAIARLQTHQLSSLGQTQTTPDGLLLTTWQMEIPMHSNQQLVPLQVRIQHEQPSTPDNKREAMDSQWRISLAFDLDPLGPLQVQAQLLHNRLSSQLWAEQASTAKLIDQELPHLREQLNSAGLDVDELVCHQGTPPQPPKTPLEQRWVDETA